MAIKERQVGNTIEIGATLIAAIGASALMVALAFRQMVVSMTRLNDELQDMLVERQNMLKERDKLKQEVIEMRGQIGTMQAKIDLQRAEMEILKETIRRCAQQASLKDLLEGGDFGI